MYFGFIFYLKLIWKFPNECLGQELKEIGELKLNRTSTNVSNGKGAKRRVKHSEKRVFQKKIAVRELSLAGALVQGRA